MIALVFTLFFIGIGANPPVLGADARILADTCVAEGQDAGLCECYAGFVEDNASAKELSALTVLNDPIHRGSMQSALKALSAQGLTPGEIFSLGMRVNDLQDKAKAQCQPE